jgi:hypothetical protein
MECIMTESTKTYAKLFTAKMAAAKMTKRLGVEHVFLAIDGGFKVMPKADYEQHKAELAALKAVKKGAVKTQQTPSKTRVKFDFGPATAEQQVQAVRLYAQTYADQGGVIQILAGASNEEITNLIEGCTTRWGAIVRAKTQLTSI